MTTQVSQILTEQYGLSVSPGRKANCPNCGHATLFVKRDDTVAKCFHPSCGWHVTTDGDNGHWAHPINKVLNDIYLDTHRELLGQTRSSTDCAYVYLTVARGIHPSVVANTMLGAIPPDYNLDSRFKQTVGDCCGSGRDTLTEIMEKLNRCLSGATGWLCFFYTDAHHRITSIRFRKPYTKEIRYFKPFEYAGLFGHGLFLPDQPLDLPNYDGRLIVVEGEFNQLQLQSLCLRHAEVKGKPPGYLPVCAVGGVTNTDYETILRITKHPIICYDNDSSGAGLVLVEKAQDTMFVEAFTTPKPDSDLDEFIQGFGNDHEAAWEAVKRLLSKRRHYSRAYEGIAAQIYSVRQRQYPHDSRRDFEINAEVTRIITEDLRDRGNFYHDSQEAYFFFTDEKKLIAIDRDDNECLRMLAKYGINSTESIFRYLAEALRLEALECGTHTEIQRLAYCNPETYTLYLSNHKNQIYRISREAKELVDNGTDGVLFLTDPRAQSFELQELTDTESWLDKTIISKINFANDLLTPDERRLVITLWIYGLFFASIMPTKPILAFVGQKGSGKSITLRKVGMLLFGERFDLTPLTDDSKDFEAAITNSAYVAIDNADSKCHWLDDHLATVATGGVIRKRELYTTNRMVEIPVRCFLAITSRTPQFRRDDVADRLLIMKVERFGDFVPEQVLLKEVLSNRNRIMTEVVNALQEVVRALRDGNGIDYRGNFRMADFASFATKVAVYAGVGAELKSILDKLSREQSFFTLENDPVSDLLRIWTEKQGNPGREITNTDLCRELAEIAEKEKIAFIFKDNPRGFAQRMANLRSNLEEFYNVADRMGRGNRKLYSFRPKPEEGK